jgi:hypothetical protein
MGNIISTLKEWKFKQLLIAISIILITFVLNIAYTAFEIVEERTVCTIVTHDVVGDKYGNIEYYTLCDCEDNTIRRLRGSNYYVMEKGFSFYYKYKVIKWRGHE